MTFVLKRTGGDPRFNPLTQQTPGFEETFKAGVAAERIETDSWHNAHQVADDYLEELQNNMGEAYGDGPAKRPRNRTRQADKVAYVAQRGAALRDNDADGRYEHIPASTEEFNAEVTRRLREEHTDAIETEALGSGAAAFLGRMWAGVTDEATVLTLPIGAAAGASVARAVGMEAIGAMAGEALTLPRQYEISDRLEIAPPNPVLQLGAAAVVGGTLGGATAAGQRYFRYRIAGDQAVHDRSPPDAGQLEFSAEVKSAEARLDKDITSEPAARQDDPISYAFAAGTIRNQPAQQWVETNLRTVVADLGPNVSFVITSGGQPATGGRRTGSTRHDHGNSVDGYLTVDGEKVRPHQDPQLYERFFERAGAVFPGIGHYTWGVHVGGGKRAAWGPGKTAKTLDPRFGAAIERGRSGQVSEKPITGRAVEVSDFKFDEGGNAALSTNPVGYVFGKLLVLGYTPNQASGLVGNMMQESGPNLDPRAVGDGGNAIGMGQWNGPRKAALEKFAAARGAAWHDVDTQIAFLHHELQTSEKGAWQAIQRGGSPAEIARIASQRFWRPGIPHLERRMNYAAQLASTFGGGRIPRGTATARSGADFTPYQPTSRGYTGQGRVSAGDNVRVDVDYQVVDASLLRRATGDLQPRDRTRAASDEQIAGIAAGLDPARLMPAPEADRGAPVVGPDNIIESGNGRVAAIERAFELFPDRAQAYVEQIEAAGFEIPDGVERPVLIGRRTSELTVEERQQFVRDANTPTVARMSATERAASDARVLSSDVLALYDAGKPLTSSENAAFVRGAFQGLAQTERAALTDAGGTLNAEGVTRLRQAIFAQAFDAPDILARFAETGAGDLRSLLTALEDASPQWASLRQAVRAGDVKPEFDVTPFVLEAIRNIADARQIARSEGRTFAVVLEDLMNDVDLLEGATSPLTAALMRTVAPEGRAVRAEKITAFLTQYAREARKIGGTDAVLFEAPSPLDALRRIEGDVFKKGAFDDVTDMGVPRIVQTARPQDVVPDVTTDLLTDGADSPIAIEAAETLADTLRQALDGRATGNSELEQIAADLVEGDLGIPLGDGATVSLRDMLDDLDQDAVLETVISACNVKGSANG